MMKIFTVLVVLVSLSLAANASIAPNRVQMEDARARLFARQNSESAVFTEQGLVRVLFGELGSVASLDESAVLNYLSEYRVAYGLVGTEKFQLTSTRIDSHQIAHCRFSQHLSKNALRVVGGDFYLHVRLPSLTVMGFTGSYAADGDDAEYNRDHVAFFDVQDALRTIAADFEFKFENELRFEHVVFVHNEPYAELSVFEVPVSVHRADGEWHPALFYVSTVDGRLVADVSLHALALDRKVYNADELEKLPGSPERFEGEPAVRDQDINFAYNNSGITYHFYKDLFNRDSYNGEGATLISSAHYGKKYNNAFWNNVQMVYGDGDGVTFTSFAADLSVVAHELTYVPAKRKERTRGDEHTNPFFRFLCVCVENRHAVVSSTAELIYFGQSGALNEGYADVMGSSAVVWHENNGLLNPGPRSWAIGSVCYVGPTPPGAPFPALRYMNNPPLDGMSRDWFPDRVTGLFDNGGVHLNSGIANLAYVLQVQGGVHPQEKNTVFVNAAGMPTIVQVWYKALDKYMTKNNNFLEVARIQENVVQEYYKDPAVLETVVASWQAVGVTPNSNPEPPIQA
jgi:bacillolysin